jgi:Zn-dependent protease
MPLLAVAAYSVIVNAALALFNLLPIPPLDGFGVVESLAPIELLPLTFKLRRWGFVILVVAIATGATSFILGPPIRFLIRFLLSGAAT